MFHSLTLIPENSMLVLETLRTTVPLVLTGRGQRAKTLLVPDASCLCIVLAWMAVALARPSVPSFPSSPRHPPPGSIRSRCSGPTVAFCVPFCLHFLGGWTPTNSQAPDVSPARGHRCHRIRRGRARCDRSLRLLGIERWFSSTEKGKAPPTNLNLKSPVMATVKKATLRWACGAVCSRSRPDPGLPGRRETLSGDSLTAFPTILQQRSRNMRKGNGENVSCDPNLSQEQDTQCEPNRNEAKSASSGPQLFFSDVQTGLTASYELQSGTQLQQERKCRQRWPLTCSRGRCHQWPSLPVAF